MTAFDALKALPNAAASRVALIEGRDGHPEPERWHVITHDPAAPNGVREFVVTHGEVVAARSVSQFADAVKPEDVLDTGALRTDSDRVLRIARDYAKANGAIASTFNFRLKKEGDEAVPVWRVMALDESGNRVGELMLTAGRGTVVAQDGFTTAPGRGEKNKPRLETYAESQITGGELDLNREGERSRTVSRSRERESRTSSITRPFKRIGGSIQRFFTGRDTISR